MSRNISRVNQFVKKYPAFSHGSLRWLIFKENENGLAKSGAVFRINRCVYIDEDKFFEVLAPSQGAKGA